MAVNSYDPTTGRPIFVDTDAPDIKVDPTQAALYAADVGSRIIRANLAALNSYAYKRKGLAGFALDTGVSYVHDGSGWVPLNTTWDIPWTNLTAATGWTANTGGGAPQVSLQGGVAWFRGGLFGGPANTTATTLPAWAAPTRTSRVRANDTASGFVYVRLFTNGVMQPSGGFHSETLFSWSVR